MVIRPRSARPLTRWSPVLQRPRHPCAAAPGPVFKGMRGGRCDDRASPRCRGGNGHPRRVRGTRYPGSPAVARAVSVQLRRWWHSAARAMTGQSPVLRPRVEVQRPALRAWVAQYLRPDLVGARRLPKGTRHERRRRSRLAHRTPLVSMMTHECPRRDSNPCYRLERPASWASRRRGLQRTADDLPERRQERQPARCQRATSSARPSAPRRRPAPSSPPRARGLSRAWPATT